LMILESILAVKLNFYSFFAILYSRVIIIFEYN
jgi:hypothetical protein